jgi:hypothetical protein
MLNFKIFSYSQLWWLTPVISAISSGGIGRRTKSPRLAQWKNVRFYLKITKAKRDRGVA